MYDWKLLQKRDQWGVDAIHRGSSVTNYRNNHPTPRANFESNFNCVFNENKLVLIDPNIAKVWVPALCPCQTAPTLIMLFISDQDTDTTHWPWWRRVTTSSSFGWPAWWCWVRSWLGISLSKKSSYTPSSATLTAEKCQRVWVTSSTQFTLSRDAQPNR